MARSSAVMRMRATHTTKRFPFESMMSTIKRDALVQRLAYYLDWAAQTYPFAYQAYNVIAQQINESRSLPRMESDQVKVIRRSIGGVRKLMQSAYGRNVKTAPGGVRASVNADDATEMVKDQMKRIRSSKDSFIRASNVIEPTELRDAKQRTFYNQQVAAIVKLIGSEAFDRKLIPPGTDDDDDDDEKGEN